ncbi:hypothetical protein [Levilactobacillus brevis]|uniref:Uncharacterized protein n=1 Tax=Levilactobacillus brevis TaxID=1580 RepID=A0AB38X2P2_LEVBR|nr:hypothetical protein [Levilactobacillus brevis]MCM6796511.1 hypothetical protein [Levilactobacillus brevis]MCP9614301.1 hypothetical protein [Levilactobacillus brevis]MCT3573847.1 hypothetical protein [Levilactobacillus brevis]WAD00929.1 hypothetical protein ORR04_08255 [Levilactobacillus brevis]
MQDTELTITDLDEPAQQTALTDFAHFYLRHYRTNDLEIIAQYKVDYAMNDINMYLYANQYFQPQQLAADVLTNKRDLFLAILQTINLPYNTNGSLKDNSWDSWYQQQYAAIDEGK